MKETLPSFWTRAMASIEHDDLDVRRRAMILRWACIVFVLLVVLGNLTSLFMLSGFMLGVTVLMNSIFAIVCIVVIRRTRRGHVDLEGGLVLALGTLNMFGSAWIAGDDDGAVMFVLLCVVTGSYVLRPRMLWFVAAFAFGCLLLFDTAFPDLLTDPQNFVPNLFLLLLGVACISQLGVISHQIMHRELGRAEQKRHEALLEQQRAELASATKSDFLASMSHELRTPLNAIIGYAELIQEENEDMDHPAHGEDVERIERSAKHLLSLINDILDLSKIEANKLDLHLEPMRTDNLIHTLRDAISPVVASHGNALVIEDDAAPEHFIADSLRLKQILLNLLSNAAKFTRDAQVMLRVAHIEDTLRFEVIDQGIGMSPEQLDTIFDEYAQATSSTARDFGGTGLGLPIARKLAELMGGSLEATSVLGEGSTFTLTLPCVLPEP